MEPNKSPLERVVGQGKPKKVARQMSTILTAKRGMRRSQYPRLGRGQMR